MLFNSGPMQNALGVLDKIIDHVFVYDKLVITIALHGNFNFILDEEVTLPSNLSGILQNRKGSGIKKRKHYKECFRLQRERRDLNPRSPA